MIILTQETDKINRSKSPYPNFIFSNIGNLIHKLLFTIIWKHLDTGAIRVLYSNNNIILVLMKPAKSIISDHCLINLILITGILLASSTYIVKMNTVQGYILNSWMIAQTHLMKCVYKDLSFTKMCTEKTRINFISNIGKIN